MSSTGPGSSDPSGGTQHHRGGRGSRGGRGGSSRGGTFSHADPASQVLPTVTVGAAPAAAPPSLLQQLRAVVPASRIHGGDDGSGADDRSRVGGHHTRGGGGGHQQHQTPPVVVGAVQPLGTPAEAQSQQQQNASAHQRPQRGGRGRGAGGDWNTAPPTVAPPQQPHQQHPGAAPFTQQQQHVVAAQSTGHPRGGGVPIAVTLPVAPTMPLAPLGAVAAGPPPAHHHHHHQYHQAQYPQQQQQHPYPSHQQPTPSPTHGGSPNQQQGRQQQHQPFDQQQPPQLQQAYNGHQQHDPRGAPPGHRAMMQHGPPPPAVVVPLGGHAHPGAAFALGMPPQGPMVGQPRQQQHQQQQRGGGHHPPGAPFAGNARGGGYQQQQQQQQHQQPYPHTAGPRVEMAPLGGYAPAHLQAHAGIHIGPPPPGLFSTPDKVPPPPPPHFVAAAAAMASPQFAAGFQHHHHQHHHGNMSNSNGFQRRDGGRGRGRGGQGHSHNHHQERRPNPHAGSERVTDEALIAEFEDFYNQLPQSAPGGGGDAASDALPAAAAKAVGQIDVNAVLSLIEANDVSFIVTDTGTGKSSHIPKALIELGHKVVSSQPRRTATVNLAARVAELRKEPLGTSVGYRVRGEKAGGDNVPLMYMTSYTLLLYILVHPTDLGYTHFIIDEFHERQPEVEVVLALLKLAKKTLNPNIKIVLMSASVEVQSWKDYFEGFSIGEYSTCEARFPVREYYLEQTCRLVGAANTVFPLTPTVESMALKNALFIIKRLLEFLAKRTNPEHSCLVFLPGRTVVEEMAQFITDSLSDRLEPIPWYRDIELDRVHAAIQRHGSRKKKVYLATDIAEVSITIPDLVFVIDSGTTKKPRIDPASRNSVVFPPLELLYVSRSALAQRRGRIGRVQPGFFFTCVPRAHTDALVDMQPQIANTRIDELSMHLLLVTPNPFSVFALCRSAPQSASVHLSESILVDSGCALPSRNPIALEEAASHPESEAWTKLITDSLGDRNVEGQSYVTTTKGYITQRLPLSVSAGLVVVNGLLFGMESEAILAAAILSSGSPFYTFYEGNHAQHRDNTRKTSQAMQGLSGGESSDIVPSVVVLLKFKLIIQAGLSDLDEEKWCLDHCCARSRMQAILKLEKQIREQLSSIVSFLDLEDVDQVLTRVAANPARISWLVASAYMERAVLCERDVAEAQRANSVGRSLFMGFEALADQNVASVVNWDKGHVVVPTTVAERYRRLLGSFSVQQVASEFYTLLLSTAFAIVTEAQPRSPTQHLMGTQLHSTAVTLSVEPNFARLLLSFREGLCLRMRLLAVMVEKKIPIDDEAGLKAALGEGAYTASPVSISQRLVGGLDKLLLTARQQHGLVQLVQNPDALSPYFAPTVRSAIMSKRQSTSLFAAPPPPPPKPTPEETAAAAAADEVTENGPEDGGESEASSAHDDAN